jgi:hypothetical protein
VSDKEFFLRYWRAQWWWFTHYGWWILLIVVGLMTAFVIWYRRRYP